MLIAGFCDFEIVLAGLYLAAGGRGSERQRKLLIQDFMIGCTRCPACTLRETNTSKSKSQNPKISSIEFYHLVILLQVAQCSFQPFPVRVCYKHLTVILNANAREQVVHALFIQLFKNIIQ